jgi:hypothetical protein
MTDHSHDAAKALAETAARYRRLDEEATERRYFRYEDEEQGLSLWEAVPYENELVAIKQVQVEPNGTVSRYWWQRMEDARGFLTDQPLYPEEEGFVPISVDEFRRYWTTRASPARMPGSLVSDHGAAGRGRPPYAAARRAALRW